MKGSYVVELFLQFEQII